jgi:hypothetical protein
LADSHKETSLRSSATAAGSASGWIYIKSAVSTFNRDLQTDSARNYKEETAKPVFCKDSVLP